MLKISEAQIESVRDQLAKATPQAVGYRLMIKPVEARKGMEAAEEKAFPNLMAAAALQGEKLEIKSSKQEAKESHGSDVGIVVAVGPDSYKMGNMQDSSTWAEVGDVVILQRYAGHRCEVPPGSGDFYQFINDEDLMGKYEGVEL